MQQLRGQIRPVIFREIGKLRIICNSGSRRHHWVCQCYCGNVFETSKYSIKYGNTSSCGCLVSELTKYRNTTHGLSRKMAIEYRAWKGMIQRCHNQSSPVYRHYGGRGIIVCDKWRHSFSDFISAVGPRPTNPSGKKRWFSLDRIDVNGNYEPGNCKWSTQEEQCKKSKR